MPSPPNGLRAPPSGACSVTRLRKRSSTPLRRRRGASSYLGRAVPHFCLALPSIPPLFPRGRLYPPSQNARSLIVAELDKSIAQVLEAYKSAVFAKDVGAFMRLCDPSVRVFDTWGVWSYEGAEAWQRAAEGWLTSLGL